MLNFQYLSFVLKILLILYKLIIIQNVNTPLLTRNYLNLILLILENKGYPL